MTPAATPEPTLGKPAGGLSAVLMRPWFWVMLVSLISLWPLSRALLNPAPKPPPVLGQVGAFTLTAQTGQPFDSKALAGKVWVANFIFSRCPTICPLFTEQMRALEKHSLGLGDRAHFLSFTVDPEYDTPEKLAAYAQEHHANPRRWTFLTGTREQLKKVIVEDLKMPMEKGADDDIMSIGHGSYFVLVDAQGGIRGFYRFKDEDAQERLLRDMGLLASESE